MHLGEIACKVGELHGCSCPCMNYCIFRVYGYDLFLEGIDGMLSQLAFGVFQNVISYAVYCEKEGWRAWAETVALINVQVD